MRSELGAVATNVKSADENGATPNAARGIFHGTVNVPCSPNAPLFSKKLLTFFLQVLEAHDAPDARGEGEFPTDGAGASVFEDNAVGGRLECGPDLVPDTQTSSHPTVSTKILCVESVAFNTVLWHC